MYYSYDRRDRVESLVGKTLVRAEKLDGVDEEGGLRMEADDGTLWRMFYEPDCCASCDIVDISGDLEDLVGSPILMAEEVSNSDINPPGVTPPDYQESFTWTFYKFATAKGYVTVTWYGASNGYYSESASFIRVAP